MELMDRVLYFIDKCRLPKLQHNFEECDNHPEFELWDKVLSVHFDDLNDSIYDLNIREYPYNTDVTASLLILYYELRSEGPWHSEKVQDCLNLTDFQFDAMYEISLEKLFTYETNTICNTQQVFDKTLQLLHKYLTPDDFKKYPALLEAYYLITKNLKESKVTLKPMSVLPISLILIDDYVDANKIKGLQCCAAILDCMTSNHFSNGNYYEVIYAALKKVTAEKDVKITESTLQCMINLFKLIPPDAKVTIIDGTLQTTLEQLYTETNLYKKKVMFNFLNKVIPMQGIHCVKRRMFLTDIADNLDICTNESVGEIFLEVVLECLENWTTYCWCIWRLKPNKKLLSVLIKVLYIYCEDEKLSERLKNILITLFKLCSVAEQKQIYKNFENQILKHAFKETFVKILSMINSELNEGVYQDVQ